jgi:predicted RNA-binding protein with TRAM domain
VPAAGNGHVHLDHVEVVAQGKLETVRPSVPVDEGATVELKLVEVGLHDAGAGVGKIGDYEVVVGGAAKLVGKKVSVTVGRALDDVAFATIADHDAGPAPITFEAEAEKPPRSQPKKKDARPLVDELPAEDEAAPSEDDEVAVAEVVDGADTVPAGSAGSAAKKRTRRGSRGGRGRKKATTANLEEESVAEGEAASDDGRLAPKIHVPPPTLGTHEIAEGDGVAGASVDEIDETAESAADGQPKRKRARRGSRGGRRRRKPATNGDAVGADGDDAPIEEVLAADSSSDSGYVPMSDWIEDFEARGS